jgi:hypothetical protein
MKPEEYYNNTYIPLLSHHYNTILTVYHTIITLF